MITGTGERCNKFDLCLKAKDFDPESYKKLLRKSLKMPPKLDKRPEAYNMNKRCAETDRGVHPHDSKHLILTRYFIIQLSLGEGANKQIF